MDLLFSNGMLHFLLDKTNRQMCFLDYNKTIIVRLTGELVDRTHHVTECIYPRSRLYSRCEM